MPLTSNEVLFVWQATSKDDCQRSWEGWKCKGQKEDPQNHPPECEDGIGIGGERQVVLPLDGIQPVLNRDSGEPESWHSEEQTQARWAKEWTILTGIRFRWVLRGNKRRYRRQVLRCEQTMSSACVTLRYWRLKRRKYFTRTGFALQEQFAGANIHSMLSKPLK